MTMDTQAPSPFGPAPANRGGYQQAYGNASAYPQGYPAQEYATPAPAAYSGGLRDAEVVEARRTHARGAMIYMLAWIVIAVALPLLFASLGLAISSGGLGATPQDLLLTGLGMLAAGMAIRGVGFSLMMKADFLIRAHAWTGPR